jgi:hypothetical protein
MSTFGGKADMAQTSGECLLLMLWTVRSLTLSEHCLAPARVLASPSYQEGRWGAPDRFGGFLED